MRDIRLQTASAQRAPDKHDAEVFITIHEVDSKTYNMRLALASHQGVVARGLPTREAALAAAEKWIVDNLISIINKLPEAQP